MAEVKLSHEEEIALEAFANLPDADVSHGFLNGEATSAEDLVEKIRNRDPRAKRFLASIVEAQRIRRDAGVES